MVQGIADKVKLLTPEIGAVEAALGEGDVAAVILEPTGASFGQAPLRPEFLHELRRLTERAGTLLIMDEVITGFRVSPGGAQVAFGVRPDLSSFAKIVAGGLPGAAVAGRADVLDRLDFAVAARTGQEKVQHPGTFNANPVSAAAGTAALGVIADVGCECPGGCHGGGAASGAECGTVPGGPGLVGLWHVVRFSPVRECGAARHPTRPVRSVFGAR